MLHVAFNAAIRSHSFSKFAGEPFNRGRFLQFVGPYPQDIFQIGRVGLLPKEPMFSAIQMRKKVSKVSGISVIAELKRSLDYARCCQCFRIFSFNHAFDSPDLYGASSFFGTMPSRPSLQTALNIFAPWAWRDCTGPGRQRLFVVVASEHASRLGIDQKHT
jgi:hypothetical protein